MIRNTSLLEWVDEYELSHEISRNTYLHMRQTASLFDKWLTRTATLADLTEHNVNRFLADYQLAGKSSHYRKNLRADLVALWNAAVEQGLAKPYRRIRSVRLTPVTPEAWSPEDI